MKRESKEAIDIALNAAKIISEMFNDIGTMITESIRINFEPMIESLRSIGDLVDNIYEVDMSVYEKLGSLGWNFSGDLPIDYIQQFIKEIEKNIDDEEINNAFIKLYSNDYYNLLVAPIAATLNRMTDMKNKDKMLNLLNGGYMMYKAENYDACVCLLTPLIEGIFSSKINNPNKKGIVEELKGLKNKEGSRFIATQIIIIKEYIDGFLRYADFDKEEPNSCINRHWVAHGRSYTAFEALDCLRLLCMIDTSLNIIEFCYE